FAIWDAKKEQLFCARDHIGIKPFFYFYSDDFFIFSNDISVLLKHPQIPQDFDDITVAYFVKDEERNSTRYATFFEKIKKLPPATSMTLSEKEVKKNVYWRIEESPPVYYKSFEEYTKKLRELFEDAVDVRLRSDYTMASHMSGGIDSSPIAVLASKKLIKQRKPLYTFNWIDIPDDSEKYEFEAWNFSRRIASEEENIIHEEFSIDPTFLNRQYETHNIFTQGTVYIWEEYYIQEQMKKMDARVMLSGWGGDELISYNGYTYISALLKKGKILSALYYLFQEKKYHCCSWSKWSKLVVRSILPSMIYKRLRSIVKPHDETVKKPEIDNYIYLMDSFAKFAKEQPDIEYPTVKGVRKRQFALFNFGHIQERTEAWAMSGLSRRMEYRYPLLDKRIVEFSVGVPEELFYHWKGKERRLFKTAVEDLLPLDIIWFNKPYETKVGRAYKKRYIESLIVLKKHLNYRQLDYQSENYFNYDKMSTDIFKLDINKVGSIIYGVLFLNAKLKLKNRENE
ncbi:MAG: hypothetical protein KAI79_01880, partial [Bacteroidales bacterium]|nr:hypothetical protein [Bacteroidales bacterium]